MRVHEEEVGIMYPVVNMDSVISHARMLAAWMEAAKKNGLAPSCGQDGGIVDVKTLEVKLIMCCGLVIEEHGHSEKPAPVRQHPAHRRQEAHERPRASLPTCPS